MDKSIYNNYTKKEDNYKQFSSIYDRTMFQPRTNQIVDTRMMQESSNIKNNMNLDINQKKKNNELQNNRFVSPIEQSVEDRIALDLSNQKRRLQNNSVNNNVEPLSNDNYAPIECVDGVCSTSGSFGTRLQKNLEIKNDKLNIPNHLIPCLKNGKYYSNIAILYSTDEHYNISCDGMCGKPNIIDGYHYGKTDLCVSCFKTYNSLIKTSEYKDPNPRNNMGNVFDNFGSIYGSGGYNNINGASY